MYLSSSVLLMPWQHHALQRWHSVRSMSPSSRQAGAQEQQIGKNCLSESRRHENVTKSWCTMYFLLQSDKMLLPRTMPVQWQTPCMILVWNIKITWNSLKQFLANLSIWHGSMIAQVWTTSEPQQRSDFYVFILALKPSVVTDITVHKLSWTVTATIRWRLELGLDPWF